MVDDTILAEATDARLIQAVDDNTYTLFVQMASALGGELVNDGATSRHFSFPSNPMFKGVWNTRLTAEIADAAIAEAVEWFRARGAPPFFWWTTPATTPPDLGNRLLGHGFVSWETADGVLDPAKPALEQGAPVMAVDMGQFDESLLTRVPAGLTIRVAETEADVLAFKQVFVESYGVPEWAAQSWVDASMHTGVGRTPWRVYIGWLDGQPVACNILVTGGGIASVWGVGTVPAARGKGIGAAITLKPLLDARAQGYRYAALFATEMGEPVYERLGFRRTGTTINRYLWRAT